MEPIFYVMAIMGCGDAGLACTEARVEPVRFQSIQQCQAQLPSALARNTDLSFPVISGTCRASGLHLATREAAPKRG